MQRLSQKEFLKYRDGAKVLEKDGSGEKVLLTPDGRICKLFRCKRQISTARFYPYAQRFADNAAILKVLGIPSVDVTGVFRIEEMERDLVVYPLLEGETLRSVCLAQPERSQELMAKFAFFLARLHDMGIYFRSVHFGNVLVLPNGEFGLIDVSDMKITSTPLGAWKRARNFKAFFRYKDDRDCMVKFGVRRFLDEYKKSSNSDFTLFETCLKLTRNKELLNNL
jgi:serine/threonine protein kinase